EGILSVGDPSFNQRAYPNLRDLPMAAVEAKRIASFYRTKAVFVEQAAVKKQIEIALDDAEVVHFATHYVPDEFSPAKSKLLLAASPQGSANSVSDDLSLEEVQTKRLPKAKVVVVAACKSGIERYYAGEGLIGLSRAFIMAGVPLVIASQWEV